MQPCIIRINKINIEVLLTVLALNYRGAVIHLKKKVTVIKNTMADDDNNAETMNTSAQENNEEMEVVTMVDVLNEERELEEDANAVLGGSDEKNCTYSKGYLKRQALYACVTCIPESKTDASKRAGVCLACSYSCHENHELIELYTKRNFRCDCGNSKFGEKKCTLVAEKSETNEDNIYNNNFSGLYCNCKRPYPDPEDNTVDDMIQCIVCEDWYHCRHLESYVPPLSSYSEMTCGNCISQHDFLYNYAGYAISKPIAEEPSLPKIVKVENETESIDVANEQTKDELAKDEQTKHELVKDKLTKDELTKDELTKDELSKDELSKDELSKDELPKDELSKDDQQEINIVESNCKMPKTKSETKGALFWPDNWRQFLCTCADCLAVYESQKVAYLIDLQDTVHVYEEKGKARALENSESQYEQGMKALSSLDRVKQVEVVSEYNAMKDQLKEYLQKFADNKKVVREEDIREFFSTMAANKKQKVDMPYFCR